MRENIYTVRGVETVHQVRANHAVLFRLPV